MVSLYYYSAYNFSLISDIQLPEFVETPPLKRGDIRIECNVSESNHIIHNEIVRATRINGGVSFDWDIIGRYNVRYGRTIEIIPRKDIPNEIIRVPLFGLALAAVLQQRDALVLHGSAVEINRQALIILGQKGHGKSTLLAALVGRGHKLISDDITALSMHSSEIDVLPGLPILKLWPDAMRELQLDIGASRIVYPGMSKRLLSLRSNFWPRSCRLGAICVLEYGDDFSMTQVHASRKLLNLSSSHYFSSFPKAFSLEKHKKVFEQCSELAKKTAMYKLVRSRTFKDMKLTCEKVERLFC